MSMSKNTKVKKNKKAEKKRKLPKHIWILAIFGIAFLVATVLIIIFAEDGMGKNIVTNLAIAISVGLIIPSVTEYINFRNKTNDIMDLISNNIRYLDDQHIKTTYGLLIESYFEDFGYVLSDDAYKENYIQSYINQNFKSKIPKMDGFICTTINLDIEFKDNKFIISEEYVFGNVDSKFNTMLSKIKKNVKDKNMMTNIKVFYMPINGNKVLEYKDFIINSNHNGSKNQEIFLESKKRKNLK